MNVILVVYRYKSITESIAISSGKGCITRLGHKTKTFIGINGALIPEIPIKVPGI